MVGVQTRSSARSDRDLTKDYVYKRRGWKIPPAMKALSYVAWAPLFLLVTILLSLVPDIACLSSKVVVFDIWGSYILRFPGCCFPDLDLWYGIHLFWNGVDVLWWSDKTDP